MIQLASDSDEKELAMIGYVVETTLMSAAAMNSPENDDNQQW